MGNLHIIAQWSFPWSYPVNTVRTWTNNDVSIGARSSQTSQIWPRISPDFKKHKFCPLRRTSLDESEIVWSRLDQLKPYLAQNELYYLNWWRRPGNDVIWPSSECHQSHQRVTRGRPLLIGQNCQRRRFVNMQILLIYCWETFTSRKMP